MRIDQLLLKEPVLDRCQAYGTSYRFLLRLGYLAQADDRGEPRDRRVLEQLAGREPQPDLIGFGDKLKAANRIPAEREEVIVDADLLDPQHAAPDLQQLFLSLMALDDDINNIKEHIHCNVKDTNFAPCSDFYTIYIKK